MSLANRCTTLAAALAAYRAQVSPVYDEILREVIDSVGVTDALGKRDLGALLLWKRIRSDKVAKNLLLVPESEVRERTGEAVAAARDLSVPVPEAAGNARSALTQLPGMKSGAAFASAVIFAAAPERMAIYDYRAHLGLWRVGLTLREGQGLYRRYMELVEQVRSECTGQNWSARDVDLALYWYGNPSGPRIYPWRPK